MIVEARHLRMMIRGVEKQHSSTITSSMLGASVRKRPGTSFLRLSTEDTVRSNPHADYATWQVLAPPQTISNIRPANCSNPW